MQSRVLVISNPADEHTAKVMGELAHLGAEAILLSPEEFGQTAHYSWRFDPEAQHATHTITLRDVQIDLDRISSVWYRRPRLAALAAYTLSEDELDFARDEWRAALEAAYALSARALWVSHPDRLREAARKPMQLALARDLGLRVPQTCITNDPLLAEEFVEHCRARVIVKATGAGWVYTRGGAEVTYVLTNRLGEADRMALQDVELAPVTFQEEIPKAYEVRVYVIGQEALAVKIDSQRSPVSALDWRRYDVERTPYTAYVLPELVARQCVALTRMFGLEFGAIDLIRVPDGEYVFLEINGNGQFLWAEELSGVHVSESLARLLAGVTPPLKVTSDARGDTETERR